jgi:hypothetical protein
VDSKELSPRQQRAMQEAHIAELKNRSVIPALEACAKELEERAASGKLAEELAGMKAGSIINNLTKILASIKSATTVIMPPGATLPAREPTHLRAASAVSMTPYERAKARREADAAVDAEVVNDE